MGRARTWATRQHRLFPVAGAPHWRRRKETRRDSLRCQALSQRLPSSPHPPHPFPEPVPTAKIPRLEGRRALRMKRLPHPHPTLQGAHRVALREGAGPGTTPTVGQVRTLRHGVPESIGTASQEGETIAVQGHPDRVRHYLSYPKDPSPELPSQKLRAIPQGLLAVSRALGSGAIHMCHSRHHKGDPQTSELPRTTPRGRRLLHLSEERGYPLPTLSSQGLT